MQFNLLSSAWGRRFQVAFVLLTCLLARWSPTEVPGLLMLLLCVGLWMRPLPGFRIRGPVLLASNAIDPVEGGVRDRRSSRWVPFHAVERVQYDAPKIELLGRDGERLAAWSQTDDALGMLRTLEAGIHAARSASDPLRLGRGEMSTAAWLSSLDQRFQRESGYRSPGVHPTELSSVLRDINNRADVRAGAAFALLSCDLHLNLAMVRSRLSCDSPPLLVAVANLVSPGILDSGSISQAHRYLTAEERKAIESFAEARVPWRYRVELAAHQTVEVGAGGDAVASAPARRA